MIREEIQAKLTNSIISNNFSGIIDCAPRVGKSKLTIDALKEKQFDNILVTAPYNTVLESWKKEFEKWGYDYRHVDLVNQRSLEKIINIDHYDLIVCDEIHSLSPNQIKHLKPVQAKILGLSGSISKETQKTLKDSLKLLIIDSYTVEQAVNDGIVSNYEINVIMLPLDNKEKYVEGGNKKNRFLTTEQKNYEYLTKQVKRFMIIGKKTNNQLLPKLWFGKRMRAIYKYKSKLKLAKQIINKFKKDKALVFTTLTDNELTKYAFHSKSTGDELDKFINDEINHLTVVNMVSMGKLMPL